jgi:hypothetical protein
MHEITIIKSNADTRTWECTCGWLTIETINAPDYHTPIEVRKADHLREVAAIDDGSVYTEIPPNHQYQLFLRRRLSTGKPNHIVLIAVWMGGWREVWNWPWDEKGLGLAQAFCDRTPTTWQRTGYPVTRGSLAIHASAI